MAIGKTMAVLLSLILSFGRAIVTSNFALFTDYSGPKIYQIDLESEEVTALNITMNEGPRAIVYDPKRSKVIWGSWVYNHIHSAFLNGSGYQLFSINAEGAYYPVALAYDEQDGNILYTAMSSGSTPSWIGVITPTGSHHKLMEHNNLLIGIAVDSINRLLFWTGIQSSSVGKANLDGSSATNLVTSDLMTPMGIAVDPTEEVFYFTDETTDIMRKCSYDGDCSIFLQGPNIYVSLAIDLSENYVYYAGWSTRNIEKVARVGSAEVTYITIDEPHSWYIGGLDVYTSSESQTTRCSRNQDCTEDNTVCRDGKCGCDVGYSLQPGNDTCVQNCVEYGATYQKYPLWGIQQAHIGVYHGVDVGECEDRCENSSSLVCRGFSYWHTHQRCYTTYLTPISAGHNFLNFTDISLRYAQYIPRMNRAYASGTTGNVIDISHFMRNCA